MKNTFLMLNFFVCQINEIIKLFKRKENGFLWHWFDLLCAIWRKKITMKLSSMTWRLSIVTAKRNIISMFKTHVLSCFVTQMHAFDARRRTAATRSRRNVLSFGASAIIRFITAAWNCGSNRTTGVLSVSKNGQSSVLVNDHVLIEFEYTSPNISYGFIVISCY